MTGPRIRISAYQLASNIVERMEVQGEVVCFSRQVMVRDRFEHRLVDLSYILRERYDHHDVTLVLLDHGLSKRYKKENPDA